MYDVTSPKSHKNRTTETVDSGGGKVEKLDLPLHFDLEYFGDFYHWGTSLGNACATLAIDAPDFSGHSYRSGPMSGNAYAPVPVDGSDFSAQSRLGNAVPMYGTDFSAQTYSSTMRQIPWGRMT